MSNYDRVVSGDGHFLVSAEIMNGTGDVIFQSHESEDGDGEDTAGTFFAHLTADEAIKLGLLIRDQGWKAKQAQYEEQNSSGGTALNRRTRDLEDARAWMGRERARTASILSLIENDLAESPLGKSILAILTENDKPPGL